jgi:hypothetical protein
MRFALPLFFSNKIKNIAMKNFKNLIILLAAFLITGVAFSQDYTFKHGDEVKNVTLRDSCWLDTTGTDTGDTLVYDFYIKPFAKYCKYNTTLTRRTGNYTKAKAYLYSTMIYSSSDVGWVLVDSITFAGTTVSYTLTSNVDSMYTQYGRIKVAPYDSMQTHSVRHGILIDTE